MGTVYRARDIETGEIVALKILHPDADPARFAREAGMLAELYHPGIVRYVTHAIDGGGAPYLAMEWLDGEDLACRLGRGRLTIAESVALVRRASEALGAAHAQGIVHRDVKPSNLLLEGGVLDRVRIIDFGIASGGDSGRRTRTATAIGTPGYMAPEQVRGERAVDARADVFALGCVLYECITGTPLFAAQHPVAILAKVLLDEAPRLGDAVPAVPMALDELAARMVAKEPADRPADAREVAAALSVLEGVSEASPETIRRPKPALTNAERRFVSLVMIGLTRREDDLDSMLDEPTLGLDPLLGVARAFDARLEMLVDGSVLVVLPGAGVATDQAARAAECALRVRSVSPDVRVALATGRAEVGAMVPVGDVIDRAVQLSHVERAPLGRPAVRMDDVTAGLLDARFERGVDAESALLFGRTEDGDARTLLAKPMPCVGREAELATLEAVLAKCVGDGVAQAVVVTAPAGMGKSRLLHEFLRRVTARAEPAELWFARGEALGGRSAFGLVGEALRRSAHVLEGEPRSARQRKLRAHVGRHVSTGEVARVTTFLGELVGAPFSDDREVALRAARRDPVLMGQQIRRAWTDLLEAECAAHPVLLVLEDLHWGDRPSVELVDWTLHEFAERPLMVLGFARPEIDEAFPEVWKARGVHRMSLSGLSRRAAERIVRSALDAGTRDEIVNRIVERASGNAFYLEELVRAASEGDVDGAPETVVAMVQSRLERFDPGVRRMLRAASVYGPAFWEGALVALLGAEARFADVRRELERLVLAEVLTRQRESRFAGEVEYAFRHALLREGAYATLTAADRVLGHRLAAAWLEAAGATETIAIAQHLELGEEPARAAAAYARAAEQALEGRDLDAVIARATRGAALVGPGELLGRLRATEAEAHLLRGENLEAEDHAEAAARLLSPVTQAWANAVGLLATAARRLGRKEPIENRVEDLFRRVAASGSSRAVGRVVVSLLQGRRADVAGELLDAAERDIDASDPSVRVWLLHARATEALHAGRYADGVEHTIAAIIAFDEIGDVSSAATQRVLAAFALLQLGAYVDAETTLRQALAVGERMKIRTVVAEAQQNLGWALVRLGRLDDAIEVQGKAIDAFVEQGNRRMEGGSRTYLASALLETGDFAGAEREARAATILLEGAPPARAQALAVFSRALLRRGEASRRRSPLPARRARSSRRSARSKRASRSCGSSTRRRSTPWARRPRPAKPSGPRAIGCSYAPMRSPSPAGARASSKRFPSTARRCSRRRRSPDPRRAQLREFGARIFLKRLF